MNKREIPMPQTYSFAGVQLRPWHRLLLRDGQALTIGSRAFEVLLALVVRSPELVSKATLLDEAWPGLMVEEANLHVQISALRRLLGPGVIGTAPGLGYRLTVPVTSNSESDLGAGPEESLLGRAQDLERIGSVLAGHRLVTITGPAGVGKSALARAIAAASSGAAWVDLAAIEKPEHLAAAVANAAKVSLGAGSDPLAALVRSLEKRHHLLVLDNIEHLVEDVAVAVRALLQGAPKMRVLATGQVSLRSNEEHVFQLAPLAQPRYGDSLEVARTSPAFALLETRVRARDDRFNVTPASLPKVISLLSALDGLPLAIEMAAARIPALGLELGGGQLVERLKRMHSIDSAAPTRHRTLWAALTWSHELLPARDQALLGLLANFVGTFSQTQAVAVAGAIGLEANAALEALEGLVDRSLVQTGTTDPPRYRMLETTRQFAVERLRSEGLAEQAELAHKEAMVSLAEAVEHGYWRQAEEEWLRCYRPEYDNLQLAFDRAIAQNDMPAAASLGLALLRIDHTNDVTPPRQRRGKLLHAGIATANLLARARSWTCLSLWSIVLVPGLTFPESARQCLAAWRLLEDRFGLHEALCLQASALARTGQLEEARSALLEARSLEKAEWPLRSLAFGLGAQYDVEMYSGEFPAALEAVASEWALLRESGMFRLATLVRAKIPDLLLLVGRRDEAVVTGQAVVAELRQMELPAFLGYALSNLCGAMLMTGDERYQRAVPALAAEAWRLTSVHGRAHLLLGVTALLAARQGKSEIALKLLGAADGWYRNQEVHRSPVTTLLECETTALAISSLGLQRSAALRAAAASQGDAEVQGWVYQALGALPD